MNLKITCDIIENIADNGKYFELNKGGDMVLENILEKVKESEIMALSIEKDAEAQSAAILDEARRQADKMREDMAQNLKLRSQDMMSKLEKEGEEQLKAAYQPSGYTIVCLRKDGKNNTEPVRRIVMNAFNPIDNSNKYDIIHIDNDKTNNTVDNLKWVTRKYNMANNNSVSTELKCLKYMIAIFLLSFIL